MQVVTSIQKMQRLARDWQGRSRRVAFVPTMGYLHAGHVSLIHRARKEVGPKGIVVVSIYVNPTQFSPTEDLSRYPRDIKRDRLLCREAGTDFLFFPDDRQMYPGRAEGSYSTFVQEEQLSQPMEGASRPVHFRGVTTIVAKLFNLVLPEVAVFGAKDFQQAAVIQRMTKDLNFPIRIVVSPTVREPDGLAMSSRNAYLNPAQRAQAICLHRAIQFARQKAKAARRPVTSASLTTELKQQIEQNPEAKVDYLSFFDPLTLQPVDKVRRGVQVAMAVFVGKTRLIDNARL